MKLTHADILIIILIACAFAGIFGLVLSLTGGWK